MLKFDRPTFRAGVIVCKELIKIEGQEDIFLTHRFYVKDKGKNFEFQNELYMLEKYPVIFTKVE